MKESVLPSFETQRSSKPKQKTWTGTLSIVLLGMTVINFVNFMNPGFISNCLHAIYHKAARWPSYTDMAARFLQHADRGLELELVQEYPYESFGHTALTPEPGIDVPEGLGSTAYPPPTTDYSSPRRMTGEPGIDIWEQRDVDEDLDSIFLSKDFVASDAVRSPRKSREDPRRLKPESVSGKGDVSSRIDWREVAEALKAYASEQTDTPDLPPEAQAIWQNLLQSIGSTAGDSEDRL